MLEKGKSLALDGILTLDHTVRSMVAVPPVTYIAAMNNGNVLSMCGEAH